ASEVAPVSPAFDAVISRCLEKEPARRYPTVADFLGDVRAACAQAMTAQDAPEPAPVMTETMGAALHIEARIDPTLEHIPAATLADVDAIMAEARREFGAVGLTIDGESASALLGVMLLPTASEAREHARACLLLSAHELAGRLAARATRDR